MGLVGYGHVGSQLGVMAEALSVKVIFYDVISLMPIGNAVAVSSLKELLEKSDFVSVNVSPTVENKNLFDKEQFAIMKKGAFFLNASYGEVVWYLKIIQGKS